MKAYYKGNKVIVVEDGKEYPFSLAVEITKEKAIQLMTKMHVNGINFYGHEKSVVNYKAWDSVELK